MNVLQCFVFGVTDEITGLELDRASEHIDGRGRFSLPGPCGLVAELVNRLQLVVRQDLVVHLLELGQVVVLRVQLAVQLQLGGQVLVHWPPTPWIAKSISATATHIHTCAHPFQLI